MKNFNLGKLRNLQSGFLKSILASLFVLCMTSAPILAQQRKDSATILIGQPAISFYQISGQFLAEVLKAKGYQVAFVEGTHEKVYPMLAAGDLDLFNALWLPNGHKAYYEKYKDSIIEIAVLYEHAGFFLGVPASAKSLNSIEDLIDSAKSKNVKRKIQGIGEGAGISMMTKEAIRHYRLDTVGYSFQPGTPGQWADDYATAVSSNQIAVIPMWKPSYMNKRFQIKALADSKNVFGSEERVMLVASKHINTKIDGGTLKALRKVSLTSEIVTALDYEVNVNGKSALEAVQDWIVNNRETFDSWIGQ
jgi:glycine betaine/proline transport system substrate-binding protein